MCYLSYQHKIPAVSWISRGMVHVTYYGLISCSRQSNEMLRIECSGTFLWKRLLSANQNALVLLTGVCVLAATSRPDLLDAALLRPGRLDRLIYCGFPDSAERGQILQALARRLRLEPAVDLQAVGQQCQGFSGADLSALLSEAQLAAVHESLEPAQKPAGKLQVWHTASYNQLQ